MVVLDLSLSATRTVKTKRGMQAITAGTLSRGVPTRRRYRSLRWFFALAVLGGDEGFGTGAQGFDGLNGGEACGGDVFEFGGDDIDLL